MDEPLTPQEIAGWLDVEVGASVTSEPPDQPAPPSWRRRIAWWMLGLGAVGVPMAPILLAHATGAKALAILAFLGAILTVFAGSALLAISEQELMRTPWRAAGDPTVTADAFGLRLAYPARRSRRVAWTEIEALEPQYGKSGSDGVRRVERWGLRLPDGLAYVRAEAPNMDRILNAIRGVLAARGEGRAMWDPASVPQSGLSRMSGEEGLVDDAALSRASRDD